MSREISFNFNKLKGRIVEILGSQQELAKKMEISGTTLSAKLNNQTEFKANEILLIAKLLSIPKNDITEYFFYSECSEN